MTTLLAIMTELGCRGGIGTLRCGARLPELVTELGPPVDLGRVAERHRWPHRFGYDDLELAVCRCRIVTSLSMVVRDGVAPTIPRHAVESAAIPSFAQVVTALDTAGCPWVPSARQLPGELTVHTEPAEGMRASFVFGTEDDRGTDEPVLAKAGAWITTAHDCPHVPAGTPDDGLGAG